MRMKGQGIAMEQVVLAIVAMVLVATIALFTTGAYKFIFAEYGNFSLENTTFGGSDRTVDYFIANSSFQALGCGINSIMAGKKLPCIDEEKISCKYVTLDLTRKFPKDVLRGWQYMGEWQDLYTGRVPENLCEKEAEKDKSLRLTKAGESTIEKDKGTQEGTVCDCVATLEVSGKGQVKASERTGFGFDETEAGALCQSKLDLDMKKSVEGIFDFDVESFEPKEESTDLVLKFTSIRLLDEPGTYGEGYYSIGVDLDGDGKKDGDVYYKPMGDKDQGMLVFLAGEYGRVVGEGIKGKGTTGKDYRMTLTKIDTYRSFLSGDEDKYFRFHMSGGFDIQPNYDIYLDIWADDLLRMYNAGTLQKVEGELTGDTAETLNFEPSGFRGLILTGRYFDAIKSTTKGNTLDSELDLNGDGKKDASMDSPAPVAWKISVDYTLTLEKIEFYSTTKEYVFSFKLSTPNVPEYEKTTVYIGSSDMLRLVRESYLYITKNSDEMDFEKEGVGFLGGHKVIEVVSAAVGTSSCGLGKNPVPVRMGEWECRFHYDAPSECSVSDFMLPQEIEDAEEWIRGYGDPKYLMYAHEFPIAEDTWTFNLSHIDKTQLLVSLSALAFLKGRKIVTSYQKARTAWGGVYGAIKTARPVRTIIGGATLAGTALANQYFDSMIGKFDPGNVNKLVLKIPLEKETITIPLENPEQPVIIEWDSKEGGQASIRYTNFHLVSPCYLDKVTAKRADIECSLYTHSMKTGETHCVDPEPVDSSDKPSCNLSEYYSTSHEYLTEAKVNGMKLSDWKASSGIPGSRIDPVSEIVDGTRVFIRGEGVKVFGYGVSLIDEDNDPEKRIDTYEVENCHMEGISVTYDKETGLNDYNYCNYVYVEPGWYESWGRDLITVGSIILSMKKGFGTIGRMTATITAIEGLTSVAVKPDDRWPGEKV